MASFLEIKKVLAFFLHVEDDIDEQSDIILPPNTGLGNSCDIVFSNDDLKTSYDSMQQYAKERLELSSSSYREVALNWLAIIPRNIEEMPPIKDSHNGYMYSIDSASKEYCLFLLNEIANFLNENGESRRVLDSRARIRIHFRHVIRKGVETSKGIDLLPELLRVNTLKISSESCIGISKLRELASSFEFHYIYKKGLAISEYVDVQEMYSFGNSRVYGSREEIDTPPLRVYNKEVLDYYTMAMEARDPFTMYISFYHIVEHYFDDVFKRKLTETIKEKITHVDFSYKDEEKLYELAKYIKKHMNSDDDSGKGDEFASLKYVLMEYVPISELRNQINSMAPNAIDYYQKNLISFTTSEKTRIAWSNPEGVYTNLAKRIYETRNALVHSKSEQKANQYRPYENKKELELEIPLIKAVAELIIINSSEIL